MDTSSGKQLGLKLALALCISSCASRPIDLDEIERIEVDGHFTVKQPGFSPEVAHKPVVLEQSSLKQLVTTARCHEGSVLWKGGIPATVVFTDGTRTEIDGFSFYGSFVRFSNNQWCEIDSSLVTK